MNGKVNEKFLSPIPNGNHRSFDNPVFASDDEKITQSPQSAIGNLFEFFKITRVSKLVFLSFFAF